MNDLEVQHSLILYQLYGVVIYIYAKSAIKIVDSNYNNNVVKKIYKSHVIQVIYTPSNIDGKL